MNKKSILYTTYLIVFILTILCLTGVVFFKERIGDLKKWFWIPFLVFVMWNFVIKSPFSTFTDKIENKFPWYKKFKDSINF